MGGLSEFIQHRIRTEGPLSFPDYMEEVLYHPEAGYCMYSTPRIRREGDFYTAPDVDPIFGTLLAGYFEKLAEGFTDFTIVELGAGKGVLARDILTNRPFQYKILERSASMKAHQQLLL